MTWKRLLGIGLFNDAGAGGGGGGGSQGGGQGSGSGGQDGGGQGGQQGAGGAGGGGNAGQGGAGSGGTFTNPFDANDWRFGIAPAFSQDEKTLTALKQFKEPTALVKSYAEMVKYQGESVRIPKADAPAEEKAKFYAKLGRPEAKEKYEFKVPDLPAGVSIDQGLMGAFLEVAFEAGMNSEQVQVVVNRMAKDAVGAFTEGQGKITEVKQKLQKEWGIDYQRRLALAGRAIEHGFSPEFKSFLKETGLGNRPEMIEFAFKVGEMMQETGLIIAEVDGVTVDTVDEEIKKIESDPAFLKRDDPKRKVLLERREQLYQLKYGTKAVPAA